MRRLITTTVLALSTLWIAIPSTQARGLSPSQLAAAGWDCFLPPAFNPNIHCAPPGQLEGIVSGTARAAIFVAFKTDDINATSAPLLGMEKLIRGDLFHDQPCPTDPTGGPAAATTSPPLYQWSWLYPRFGWDYYICHNFDSPW